MKKYIIIFISILSLIILIPLIYVFVHDNNEQMEYIEKDPFCEMESAEADDVFSERIINASDDTLIYRGKTVSENLTQYEFVYDYSWTKEDVKCFSNAITENAGSVKEKTQILVGLRSGSQSLWAFTLDNTSDDSLKRPDYDGFYRLRLDDYFFDGDSSYLELISSIGGIRKLETTERFMEESKNNGIDWYEVWPDLEEIVILENK